MPKTKLELLREVSFGSRIAEDEAAELQSYFVRTDIWNRIFAGEIDIIYGSKGSGKSAIYAVLTDSKEALASRNVLLITAENPRGATVFSDLVNDPPTSEQEFVGLWKLYFLTLIGTVLKELGGDNPSAKILIDQLEAAKLLELDTSLRTILRSVIAYVRRVMASTQSISTTLELDPHTGTPTGVTGKITLKEPTSMEKGEGFRSVDDLFATANAALETENSSLWILLDRLDVAFADDAKLERNALRALFKVYLDLLAFPRITPKIFIRSDIWRRLTQEGFREASHIIRSVTISWEPTELRNLVIRRILKNPVLVDYYHATEREILRSSEDQVQLFDRVFPEKVDLSDKKPTTFDWIVSRCRDGSGIAAPREIIHLLSATREQQVRKLERGDPEPPGETLFVGQAFKDALPEVSKARLENTLLAEYPQFRDSLLKLEGKRTQQSLDTLSAIWSVSEEEALETANALAESGFFETRSTNEGKQYWIPFLYRPCLSLVQGTED